MRNRPCLMVLKFHPGPPRSDSVLLRLFFQFFYNTYALFVVAEPAFIHLIQQKFSCVSERCMPQIMSQCDCLHQIFVQPERLRNGSRILRYFKRMCQPRPVMISHRCEKNLRLTFSVSGKTYCAGYGHGPSERPDEYHTAVPPCLCPFEFMDRQAYGLKVSASICSILSRIVIFCSFLRHKPPKSLQYFKQLYILLYILREFLISFFYFAFPPSTFRSCCRQIPVI